VLHLRHNIKSCIQSRLILAGALAATMGLAGSRPALATPSTLGFYPSTDLVADRGFHLDIDTYRANGISDPGFDTGGLTAGFGNTEKAFGRTEAGFDYVSSGAATGLGDRLLFNAKTQLYSNPDSGLRVVGGGWLLGGRGAGAPNIGYVAGSKALKQGRVTLGVAHAFRNQPAGTSETFLQLGYDRMLTSKLSFAADFYSGKGPFSGIQPTLYYAVNDKAGFGIGYFFNSEPTGGANNDQLYLCFDYNFGGRSQTQANPDPVVAPQ
jgi:hypothetical protein